MSKKKKSNQMRPASLLKKAETLFENFQYKQAEPYYRKLLQQKPDHPLALYHLGQIRYNARDFQDAIPLLEQALSVAENTENRAMIEQLFFGALRDSHQQDRILQMARDFFDNPARTARQVLMAFLAFTTVCDWERMTALLPECIELLLNCDDVHPYLKGVMLDSLAMDGVTPETILKLAHRSVIYLHVVPIPLSQLNFRVQGRIKVAYLSADFCNHPVGYFIHPLLSAHDHSRFEVYCYANNRTNDRITDKIRAAADHFIDVSGISMLEVAKKIHAEGIHIAVDLGGPTEGSLLDTLEYRPAPVQITYLGYAGTTGMDTIDFRITDHYAESETSKAHYSEELLYMPNSFICFGMRPSCERNTTSPCFTLNRITFGSFNNTRKLTPRVVATWSKILNQVPGSHLVQKAKWVSSTIVDNVKAEFAKHGIDSDRLEFFQSGGEYDEHVASYNAIDIALDTFPYTGTTTTCEALWMGVPVITLVGESHVHRVSYSIMKNIGFEATITYSEEEYIAKAVDLALNPERLNVLRPSLHMMFALSTVTQPQSFVPDLEKLYLGACEKKGVNLDGAHSVEITAMQPQLFAELPDAPFDRALVVVSALTGDIKNMADGYMAAEFAPKWMVVAILSSSVQDDIALYFEQHDRVNGRGFYIMKLGGKLTKPQCTALVGACRELHQLEGSSAETSDARLVAKVVTDAKIKVVEYPSRTNRGVMVVDRLVPELWRMLHAYLIDGKNMPKSMIMAIPTIEYRDQIVQYIQNMYQFDLSATDIAIEITYMTTEGVEEQFFHDVLKKCGSLHLPQQSSSPLQKMAETMAQQMDVQVVWHDKKPAYMPEPLPPVEDFHVTVVILTYNRVELLKRAVESVLQQTYDNFTVKIFDDASSDATEEYCQQLVMEDSRVIYHRNQENLGLGKNVRHAIKSIGLELFIGLADDDFLLEEKAMERMVEKFRNDSSIGMVFGQCEIGDVAGEQISAKIPGNYNCDCMVDAQQMMLDSVLGNHMFGGGNIYRRSALERMAQYATNHWRQMTWLDVMIGEGDYLCNLLMVMCCRVAYVHFPVVHYSVGNETYSSSQLGGGWSIEIRLRTVAFLDEMYHRKFGKDRSEDSRIRTMVSQFETQLQDIDKSLTDNDRDKHQKQLAIFHSVLTCIGKHEFPEILRHSSKD